LKPLGQIAIILYILFALMIVDLLDLVIAISRGDIVIEPEVQLRNGQIIIIVNGTNNSFHTLEVRVKFAIAGQEKVLSLTLDPWGNALRTINLTLSPNFKEAVISIDMTIDGMFKVSIERELEVRA